MRIFTPALDMGSHINARHEPRPEAGAQRTLEAVGSMPLILIEALSSADHRGMLALGENHWLRRRRPPAILYHTAPI
jgi:hypothetical protein